jgi:Xaa-Pro aminopeptidase
VNVSSTDWSLSERPFLLILTPSSSTTSQLSILVPKFELSRAQSLHIALGGVGEGEEERWINWVTWDEADDPYMVLIEHLEGLREREGDEGRGGWNIGLEENVRTFVGEGIRSAVGKRRSWDERQDERVEVRVGLVGIEVRELRMRKTEAELRILRCVAKVSFALRS